MKISLLIDEEITNKISDIKRELYAKGVRAAGKIEAGIPHIKIAEALEISPTLQRKAEDHINKIFQSYRNNKISNFKLVNEEREDSNWIALQISEAWLLNLSKEIEFYLESLRINQTFEYKTKIYNLRKLDHPNLEISLDECIGDHMNLVNKCKKEFAEESIERFKFLQNYKEISVDKILYEE